MADKHIVVVATGCGGCVNRGMDSRCLQVCHCNTDTSRSVAQMDRISERKYFVPPKQKFKTISQFLQLVLSHEIKIRLRALTSGVQNRMAAWVEISKQLIH